MRIVALETSCLISYKTNADLYERLKESRSFNFSIPGTLRSRQLIGVPR